MAKWEMDDCERRNTRLVGVGASAGGVTALQSLFKAWPGEMTIAVVVNRLAGLVANLGFDAGSGRGGWAPTGRSVIVSGLRDRDKGDFSLSIRLTPLQTSEHSGSPYMLVSFVREQDPRVCGPNADDPLLRVSSDIPALRRLEDVVRISHEELEASREELQAFNEELTKRVRQSRN